MNQLSKLYHKPSKSEPLELDFDVPDYNIPDVVDFPNLPDLQPLDYDLSPGQVDEICQELERAVNGVI